MTRSEVLGSTGKRKEEVENEKVDGGALFEFFPFRLWSCRSEIGVLAA
jgi:hypothetical protein